MFILNKLYVFLILINRYYNPTLDWYYNLPSDPTHYIQYEPISEPFLFSKVDSYHNIHDTSLFFSDRDDLYGTYCVEDSFEFLITSQFYSFFTLNNVDVARFMKRTKSVKRHINEIDFLKFNNYFMRSGKREKSLKILNTTLRNLFPEFTKLRDLIVKSPSSWHHFYMMYSHLTVNYSYQQLNIEKDEIVDWGNMTTQNFKNVVSNWRFKTILFRNLGQMLPIFSFYIYKVDKQIFKNTRGKSGKYTFIWKYVTQYKRVFIAMYWLLKELRIMPGRSIGDRMSQLIKGFVFSPEKTWIYRVKKFSSNYVYRNCRHTLAEHYRTVTK